MKKKNTDILMCALQNFHVAINTDPHTTPSTQPTIPIENFLFACRFYLCHFCRSLFCVCNCVCVCVCCNSIRFQFTHFTKWTSIRIRISNQKSETIPCMLCTHIIIWLKTLFLSHNTNNNSMLLSVCSFHYRSHFCSSYSEQLYHYRLSSTLSLSLYLWMEAINKMHWSLSTHTHTLFAVFQYEIEFINVDNNNNDRKWSINRNLCCVRKISQSCIIMRLTFQTHYLKINLYSINWLN